MLDNCAVANNRADGVEVAFGGGIYNNGSLTVENCLITGNVAATFGGGGGGGIANNGSLTDINSTFANNQGGSGHGGGLYNEAGRTATVTSGTMNPLPLISGNIGATQTPPATFSIPHLTVRLHLAQDSLLMEFAFGSPGVGDGKE